MKHLLYLLLLLSCSTPKEEPSISLNDWSEDTKSKAGYIAADTYTVVISFNNRQNDTIVTTYSHYPTTKTDVMEDYFTKIPCFKAPDNEKAKQYMNVKEITVIKATVSPNNIEYIQEMLRKQDSTKELIPIRKNRIGK